MPQVGKSSDLHIRIIFLSLFIHLGRFRDPDEFRSLHFICYEMGVPLFVLCGILIICLELDIALSQNDRYNTTFHYYSRYRRQSCRQYEFHCGSGECIDDTNLCDGKKDCSDGSDETGGQCSRTRCPPYAFQCSYGACVDGRAKCNGIKDCVDGSDEQHPSCKKQPDNGNCRNNNFKCESGKCIDNTLLCDGLKDCDDGSDETFSQCNSYRCPPFTFRCSYGGCIDRTRTCDGRPHCADASDEDPVLCGTAVKPVCKLPAKPDHGDYKILNCNPDDSTPFCRKVPGTEAEDLTLLEFQCDAGYNLAGNSQVYCFGGEWKSPHPTCGPVLCPKLESVSVDIRCSLNNEKVDCDKPMAPGTEALLACKVAYRLTNEPGYNKVVCQANGFWNKPVFTCIEECGKRNPKGKPFVSNGEVAQVGEFPWHIGIYRISNGGPIQQCGGSLINPTTVVTAAHCFWNEQLAKVNDKSEYVITAGKYYRDWNNKDEEMQERNVSDIIVHDEYRGRPGLFRSDIAIVKLDVAVHLTWAVLPVCVDFNNEYERFQLTNGKLGSIVGWGVTEKNEPSEALVTTQLPFVDFTTCWDSVPETFRPYLTKDKFCAGYKNGTSVCPGDSGGGLAFENNERFYLRGIVSIGVEPERGKKCFTNQYTAFTKVSDFLPWIEPYVR
ncbi:hypothetical protein C0J52_06353 [Blattella germanica]|nr:hypothetical protein C0J52_06353 [Blattella germanica]